MGGIIRMVQDLKDLLMKLFKWTNVKVGIKG